MRVPIKKVVCTKRDTVASWGSAINVIAAQSPIDATGCKTAAQGMHRQQVRQLTAQTKKPTTTCEIFPIK